LIDRLLIANRGEIACRIVATCRRLGILPVAVFTEVDARGAWVEQSDEAYRIEDYLEAQKLIEVALRAGVEAVHPGFGFLAENADFARAVQAAGLLWVGPSPESMELLASKQRAKALAASVGVPVLESVPEEQASFPLMVKALAGGGGKGMRKVERLEDLSSALQSARSEALRAFGDERVMLEPWLYPARHIEVQIFGDSSGQVIHLGERDCSLQRRHQKILEESPAPDLAQDLRDRLHQAALKIARAACYCNAGTVEFLVQAEQFYFLEVNTRLQVEHPVTEEVTGWDLVEWQLRVAQGQLLPPQDSVPFSGHAIEVRLYAEDPTLGHLPSCGTVVLWEPPTGVRVESALRSGDEITPHYDPMVAKLIARSDHRLGALKKLRRALEQTVLFGPACNRDFLLEWTTRAEKQSLSVQTLDEQPDFVGPVDDWAPWAAAAACWLEESGQAWRNVAAEGWRLHFEGHPALIWENPPCGQVSSWLWLEREGCRRWFRVLWQGDEVFVASRWALTRLRKVVRSRSRRQAGSAAVVAPLTGSVVEVLVNPGQAVSEGDTLIRLEAMKMEHRILSPCPGVIEEVLCWPGEVVQAKTLLVRFQA